MFFDGWWDLGRVLIVGTCAYGGLVLLLRISGKRTLAKMNAFDLVVTVALGSTLASTLTSAEVALADGLVAMALLIVLQVLVAFTASRWGRANRIVKSEPRLLARRGRHLHEAMRAERVTQDEVDAALRENGLSSLDEAEAVVLESSGEISVIPTPGRSGGLGPPAPAAR